MHRRAMLSPLPPAPVHPTFPRRPNHVCFLSPVPPPNKNRAPPLLSRSSPRPFSSHALPQKKDNEHGRRRVYSGKMAQRGRRGQKSHTNTAHLSRPAPPRSLPSRRLVGPTPQQHTTKQDGPATRCPQPGLPAQKRRQSPWPAAAARPPPLPCAVFSAPPLGPLLPLRIFLRPSSAGLGGGRRGGFQFGRLSHMLAYSLFPLFLLSTSLHTHALVGNVIHAHHRQLPPPLAGCCCRLHLLLVCLSLFLLFRPFCCGC